jgi:hypothetical protein
MPAFITHVNNVYLYIMMAISLFNDPELTTEASMCVYVSLVHSRSNLSSSDSSVIVQINYVFLVRFEVLW